MKQQTEVKRKVKPKAIRIAKKDNQKPNDGREEDQTTENMEQNEQTVEGNRDLENDGSNESQPNMDFSNEILSNGNEDIDRTLNQEQIDEDLSRIEEEEEEEYENENENNGLPKVETLEEVLERMKSCKSVEQLVGDQRRNPSVIIRITVQKTDNTLEL